MPVTKEYLHPTPSGSVTPSGGEFTVKERIAWVDIDARLEELFPSNDSSNLYTTEVDPFTGRFYASRAEFGPQTDLMTNPALPADALPTYENCILTITYSLDKTQRESTNDWQNAAPFPDPQQLLTHTLSIGGEFINFGTEARLEWLTIDTTPYIDVVDSPTGIEAGFPVVQTEHQIKWNRVVSPPWDAIQNCMGKVNHDNFTSVTRMNGLPRDTLLFLGAEASREIMTNGARAWELTYRFSERYIVDFNTVAKTSHVKKYEWPWPAITNPLLVIDNRIYQSPAFTTYIGQYAGWNHYYNDQKGWWDYLLVRQDRSQVSNPASIYVDALDLVFKRADFSTLFSQA